MIWYEEGLRHTPHDTEMLFNHGVALERLGASTPPCVGLLSLLMSFLAGKILESAAVYNEILALDSGHSRARLNIAALHHMYGNRAVSLPVMRCVLFAMLFNRDRFVLQDAVLQYEHLLKYHQLADGLLGMVLSNLAQAKIDLGQADDAVSLMRQYVVLE